MPPFSFASMNAEVRYLIRLAAFAIAIFLLFCILSPTGFLSTANLSSMAYQLPEFAMLALAIHPTMLTGGIDLSVVSVANLSGIVAALTMRSLPPQFILLAMLIGLLIGCVAGVTNGLLVANGLPAILATLGTMQLFAGIAVVLAYSTGDSGASVTGIPGVYSSTLNGSVFARQADAPLWNEPACRRIRWNPDISGRRHDLHIERIHRFMRRPCNPGKSK
jgi:simple sugar transport system permease protein